MLAYVSPASSSTNSPRHNTNVQLPAATMTSSGLRPTANTGAASRGSAPSSATTSPLFQPSHPATPPAFALASPVPVRLSNIGKSLSVTGTASLKPSPVGTPFKGMHDKFDLDGASALQTTTPEPIVRRCENLQRGLREFEDILLDEVESSESSSDISDVEDMEMTMENAKAQRTRKDERTAEWQKGVARDTPRFQLIVDVPLWTPGCFQDLSSMQDVRDKTLASLHTVVDNLRLRGGVRTTYRLLSTANGGSWGCIRVAPFMSSTFKHQSFINRNETKVNAPAALRRSTFAGPALSHRLFGGLGGSLSTHHALLAGGASEDEKQEAARVVKMALEKDGDGVIPEARVFLLALNGQPALIIT
ncbi:hypothetical protein QFC21_004976 [Naganishia friedmannii]|uniref:Uncharacterized protein n=1 Tax=Naganishia friedmannii TaxID=89922 RepID=A0ACC2VFG4_9TREE|nr:hypothetical protein QFC21_004976 [Naganishia friedmannii]